MSRLNIKEDSVTKKDDTSKLNRKRKIQDDGSKAKNPKVWQNLAKLVSYRISFDKEKFESALRALSECDNPICDPLFRRTSLRFNPCKNCWVHWRTLNEMV